MGSPWVVRGGMWSTPLPRHGLSWKWLTSFVSETCCLRKVVRIEREKHFEPFIPICCWHKDVNIYIVCVNNQKNIVKKMINSLGVSLYTSFLLFVLFLTLWTLLWNLSKEKGWHVWDVQCWCQLNTNIVFGKGSMNMLMKCML